ncbi:FAD-binding domain-containing protein [Deinococcus misasensis]|uniref:FAD-binding domain-containing protein n=1 Tax=Deinococcus misasensis TaxID=392413 RepID=UPI000553E985|nr:FAD-binding domain-containing protein [Deinococcus misasensis]
MPRLDPLVPDAELVVYLREALAGLYSGEVHLPEPSGGREEGLKRLRAYSGKDYAARNELAGNVSRLSPYLRHGMLGLKETAEHARRTLKGKDRSEFLRQLAWKEFFSLVFWQQGDRILENMEPPKYSAHWTPDLPEDLREGQTGLPCVDAWVKRLKDTGYLHNHERLWFAAYTVHFRKVHWKAGYAFFRGHLLDGDVASNALSWQWVASTFSSKPYIMNKDNIYRYSAAKWCSGCTADCPFHASYEALQDRLFGQRFS